MNRPFISIVINCLNGEEYLREAIDSIYDQTYTNWEIIFWDNASTDKSAAIAKSYGKKLRYFLSGSIDTLYNARNKAVVGARGEYLAFLDCDDWWYDDFLLERKIFFDDEKKRPQISYIDQFPEPQSMVQGIFLQKLSDNLEGSKKKVITKLPVGSSIIANNYFWLHGRKPFAENKELRRELLRIRGKFFDKN